MNAGDEHCPQNAVFEWFRRYTPASLNEIYTPASRTTIDKCSLEAKVPSRFSPTLQPVKQPWSFIFSLLGLFWLTPCERGLTRRDTHHHKPAG